MWARMSNARSAHTRSTRLVQAVEALEARRLLASLTIAQENALAGTPASTWDVPGTGGDPTLVGFATNMSVNRGTSVSFKVTDTTATPYQISIYRLGYYGGLGAALKTTIASPTIQAQPAPITDSVTGLIDCGNWSVSASWSVPAAATSGVYIADLVKSGKAVSQIPFIVRNDASKSAILYQTSDTTWEAYNSYGGNSLYEANGSSAQDSGNTPRAAAVSYNRPFINRGESGGPLEGYLFSDEYPMIRWLESNGYDVSYEAEVDTARAGVNLKNHKIFMSSGHDEYWSPEQRANVQAARDAGVSLAFFSANEVFWKTRWSASSDGSNTAYRTITCYKETLADGKIDPSSAWTGTWRDPRFSPPADGGTPENALSGQLFMVNGIRNDAITVPATDAGLRFWRNTSIASLGAGQVATLPAGTLGYEWDEDVDNGFRPAGEIDLSSTTLDVSPKLLQDYGSNYGSGVAHHSLTFYRAASGAKVFAAGTTQWSWGLDATHDRAGTPVSHDMQQATVNLLADMGAQPSTVHAGLIKTAASLDTTAPTTKITSPTPSAAFTNGVAVTITGTGTDTGGGIVAGVEVSTDGGSTWHPAVGTSSWSYTWIPRANGIVKIMSRATDDSGNIEKLPPSVSVTTSGAFGLFTADQAPASASNNDAKSVELGMRFRSDIAGCISGIRFYKGAGNIGTHTGNLWSDSGALLATGTFANESGTGWQQLNFAVPVAINANTNYVASYFAPSGHYAADPFGLGRNIDSGTLHGLADATQGESNGVYSYASSSTFPTQSVDATNYWVDVVFSTTAATAPPVVTAETPAPNATNVTSAAVTATFNESVSSGSIAFTLSSSIQSSVPASVTYDDTTHTATLTPLSPLATSTTYTASIAASDTAGHAMTSPATWSFTTAAANASFSLWLPTDVPGNASQNDSGSVNLGMRFRSDTAGYITAIRFYKGATNGGTHIGALWSDTGAQLANVTFTGESATGWQQAVFSTPVAVTANTLYVASYFAPQGHYADDGNYFASERDSGPLHAIADGAGGESNGVYAYGSSLTFPANSYLSSNYWVDVVFATAATSTVPPAVGSITPASGATAVPSTTPITAVFSESVIATSVTMTLIDSLHNVVLSTVSYNDATHMESLIPLSPLAAAATYTVTISGAKDLFGNTMTAPFTSTFTTAAANAQYSFWSPTDAPVNASQNDSQAVELGVKFTSDVSGTITGIRFYKGATNLGSHVGHLWSATGTLLGTVAFSGETASGCEEADFATPIAITANTVYVASYLAPQGHYAADQNSFNTGLDRSPLHIPSDSASGGNGLYHYGATGGFPDGSYRATNYWVDVVFKPGTGSTTLAAVQTAAAIEASKFLATPPPSMTGDVENKLLRI